MSRSLDAQLERLRSEMDRKLPSLETEIAELKGDLKGARNICSDLQLQLVTSGQAYEQLKGKLEKYQAECSKKEKYNVRLRSEKEELEK